MKCKFCGADLDPDNPRIYRAVLLWVTVEKGATSAIVNPKYTDSFACDSCISKLTAKQAPLRTLFDFIDENGPMDPQATDLATYDNGAEIAVAGEDLTEIAEPQVLEPGEAIDYVAWTAGFEAGWRGDELIDRETKLTDYLTGYDVGLASRDQTVKSHGEWAASPALEVTSDKQL